MASASACLCFRKSSIFSILVALSSCHCLSLAEGWQVGSSPLIQHGARRSGGGDRCHRTKCRARPPSRVNVASSPEEHDQTLPSWLLSPLFSRNDTSKVTATTLATSSTLRSGAQSPLLQNSRSRADAPTLAKAEESGAAAVELVGYDRRISLTVGMAYFCNGVALNLPIVLMPAVADAAGTASPAAFVASVASVATLGGGVGKFVNGLVCQVLGGRTSLSLYMTGIAAMSLVFSYGVSSNFGAVQLGWTLGCMEFFWSILWTACSVVLADYFESKQSPGATAQFALAITTLGFFSTAGTIVAKVGGTALLSVMGSPEKVGLVGALASLAGLFFAFFGIPAAGGPATSTASAQPASRTTDSQSSENKAAAVVNSFRQVVGSPLFWLVGLAHCPSFVARTTDRVLGSFYAHVAPDLSKSLCGGLTTSCTLGFLHGLNRGKTYHQLPTKEEKLNFLRQNYVMAGLATAGLAVCGGPWAETLMASPSVRAAVVAILSAIMTSSFAFQFYQIPNLFGVMAPQFTKHKAILLSLMDGLGYFCSTAVWAVAGGMVATSTQYGWVAVWAFLLLLYAGGGGLMLHSVQQLNDDEKRDG